MNPNTTQFQRTIQPQIQRHQNSNTITANTDETVLSEIATLKDKIKWAEQHIKHLEERVNLQQKDIDEFKHFVKEIKDHNTTVNESSNKLISYQEQRSEREQLQFQYIPEQNLNQPTNQGHRRNSREGRITPTYNSFNTPQNRIAFQVYNHDNYHEALSHNFGDHSQQDQGWDYESSQSSLHTPNSSNNSNRSIQHDEVVDLDQDEHLSQYGVQHDEHFNNQNSPSHNNNNGWNNDGQQQQSASKPDHYFRFFFIYFSFFSNSSNKKKFSKKYTKNYNNNKKQKNSYFSSFNSHSYINFGTLNLQGSFETKKREQISYMIHSDIHFLLLTETHLKDSKNTSTERLRPIKFNYPVENNEFSDFYIIHNPSNNHSASGVSCIISSFLYKHIQKIDHILGRLIHVQFFFKRHEQLHIIGLYLPPIPSSKNNETILKSLVSYLNKYFISKNKFKKSIIMGDFNINPHKPNSTLLNSSTNASTPPNHVTLAHYHKTILTILKNNLFQKHRFDRACRNKDKSLRSDTLYHKRLCASRFNFLIDDKHHCQKRLQHQTHKWYRSSLGLPPLPLARDIPDTHKPSPSTTPPTTPPPGARCEILYDPAEEIVPPEPEKRHQVNFFTNIKRTKTAHSPNLINKRPAESSVKNTDHDKKHKS
ncbi:unnamed protein product [Rhizophagus irregularis]|nr:unnamed protein product [Rhizophagus irregularis]